MSLFENRLFNDLTLVHSSSLLVWLTLDRIHCSTSICLISGLHHQTNKVTNGHQGSFSWTSWTPIFMSTTSTTFWVLSVRFKNLGFSHVGILSWGKLRTPNSYIDFSVSWALHRGWEKISRKVAVVLKSKIFVIKKIGKAVKKFRKKSKKPSHRRASRALLVRQEREGLERLEVRSLLKSYRK